MISAKYIRKLKKYLPSILDSKTSHKRIFLIFSFISVSSSLFGCICFVLQLHSQTHKSFIGLESIYFFGILEPGYEYQPRRIGFDTLVRGRTGLKCSCKIELSPVQLIHGENPNKKKVISIIKINY